MYRIGDVELASRLSFFLWSSIPDDELLRCAERGALAQARGARAASAAHDRRPARRRVRRQLRRASGCILRNLDAVIPVQSIFPNFDDTLREGLRRETELFFASVLREDRSVLDLLDADYTFVNERVARHYGLPNVKGSHFRRVQLPADSPRRGLLGHGSMLAVTSYADRTSPVVRGHWILENLLGAEPPPPPANVPPLEATSVTDGNGTMLSLRERLAAHRANPSCASCHTLMDSVGFALEGFDAVGPLAHDRRARATRSTPRACCPTAAVLEGLDEFRAALLNSELVPRRCSRRSSWCTRSGRGVEHYDMPAVRAIVRDAAARGASLLAVHPRRRAAARRFR